jgi:hypothetical protein
MLSVQLLRSCMRTLPQRREGPALLSNEEGIRAREHLMAGRLSEVQPHWISPAIRDSWQRCLNAKLDPHSPPDIEPIRAAQLRELRAASARIYEIARMECWIDRIQSGGNHHRI